MPAGNGAPGRRVHRPRAGVERVEQGVLVVSVDRLAHVLRDASRRRRVRTRPQAGEVRPAGWGSTGLYPGGGDDDHRLPLLQRAQSRESDRSRSPAMPAVQVQAALARRCGRRLVRGGDDCVGARSCRFLGGVVRAVSDDLARARGPGQESRGTPEGSEGRRRRESRTRHEVWRAVDPVAGRDPRRARDRPRCRRASSRCAGAAVAPSARSLSVDPGSTLRERGVSPRADWLEPRVKQVREPACEGLQRIRADSPATRGCSWANGLVPRRHRPAGS